MGRRPALPEAIPRLRKRMQKSGRIYYYYDTGERPRRELPLGDDYGLALIKYAELEQTSVAHAAAQEAITLEYVIGKYKIDVLPKKAPRTQKDNERELKTLIEFFCDPPGPLDSIAPKHVHQFLRWRGQTAKVRANREKALLSAIWNYARQEGFTDRANPCAGIKGHKEAGRDVYVEDELFNAVYDKADTVLRDAMDLAYLTGQRVTDIRLMDERDVRDGFLHVTQGKTRAKRRIELVGALAAVLARIKARKASRRILSPRLLVTDAGAPLSYGMLRQRFDKARRLAGVDMAAFQFRDLRAKAGTDKVELSGDVYATRDQLGHTTVRMTEQYLRDRKGKKVTPTR